MNKTSARISIENAHNTTNQMILFSLNKKHVNTIIQNNQLSIIECAIVIFIWKYLHSENLKISKSKYKDIKISVSISISENQLISDLLVVISNIKDDYIEICNNYLGEVIVEENNNEFVISTNISKLHLINEGDYQEIIESLLNQIQNNPSLMLKELIFTSESKIRKLIYEYNNTLTTYSKDMLVHELFMEQAVETPNNIAITDNKKNLTYRELDIISNQLAQKLSNIGIKDRDYIVITMNRSIDMIVCMMAILKVGAVYIPIDSATPAYRFESIMSIAEYSLNIMDNLLYNKYKTSLQDESLIIVFDSTEKYFESNDRVKYISYEDLKYEPEYYKRNCEINSLDLAYIIFTSGTTGTPKGVKVTHRSVINIVEWINKSFKIDENDTLLFVTSISFDLSVYDIFGILACGATIRLTYENDIKDVRRLYQILNEENITIWDSAPAMLQQVILFMEEYKQDFTPKENVKYFLLSGDWIPVSLPEKLKKHFPKSTVVSLGGATEATIWSNYYIVEHVLEDWNSIPYGKPIQNSKYYILDENKLPLPENFDGELFIGGECLASGYFNDIDLTNEKFVKNPFTKDEKIYATGDLARWKYDGNIELLGRIDTQVKIRGFRVELEEIKYILNELDYVKDSVIITEGKNHESKDILVYVLLNNAYLYDSNNITLKGWKSVFEENYTWEADKIIDKFAGWNDSLTGNRIPEIEMEDWLNDILVLIESYQPKCVLEIGCGTGMIMFGLLDKIESYFGSDLSENVINYLSNKLECSQYAFKDVKLICQSADNFDNYEANNYDTIILNSVVQYFPDFRYLLEVIKNSLSLISKSGGRIIIGDIRNYATKNDFDQDYQMNTQKFNNTELFLSPEIFSYIQDQIPQICNMEILFKNGVYNNELTLYRYDVILHTNQDAISNNSHINNIEWHEYIKNKNNTTFPLLINNVPLSELNGYNRGKNKNISNILKLKSNVLIKFYYSTNNKDYGKILLSNKDSSLVYNISSDDEQNCSYKKFDISQYVNFPISVSKKISVVEDIYKHLREKLPYYMIPANISVIDFIPLTQNGKVDVRKFTSNYNKSFEEYILPKSETEVVLQRIFQKVLNVPKIGIEHRFSDWGGHSIKATVVTLEIKKHLNMEITVKQIFSCQTIQRIAQLVDAQSHVEYIPIIKCNKKMFLASSNQRRMFVAQKQIRANKAYNIVDITLLSGDIDYDRIIKALEKISQKHLILRTIFIMIADELWQKANDNELPVIEIINIPKHKIDEKFIQSHNKAFDLERGPLWKIIICNCDNNEHIIIIIFHHIIMDGISLGFFKNELSSLYKNQYKHSPAGIQMIDYSNWESEMFKTEYLEELKVYWNKRLNKVSNLSYFYYDYAKPSQSTFTGINCFYTVPKKLHEEIDALASILRITPYTILTSALILLLSKHTQNEDIIVGTVVANRTHSDLSSLLGMLVNTVPLRFSVNIDDSLKDYLLSVNESIRNDLQYQDYPYEYLSEDFNNNNMRSNIFSVLIAYQNIDNNPLELSTCTSEKVRFESDTSKFDISFIFNEVKNGLELEVEYSTDLYRQSTINYISEQFFYVLESILSNNLKLVKEIKLSDDKKNLEIYKQFNNTYYPYNENETYIERFMETCNSKSSRIAIVDGDKHLTYGELQYKCEKIATCIQLLKLPKNSIIAILAEPSSEVIAAQIAILCCGHAFLRLDKKHPMQRNNYIISDSQSRILLYYKDKPDIIEEKVEAVDIHDMLMHKNTNKNLKDIYIKKEKSLAYVIYTSGSTGTPKGVIISCESLLNLCLWHNDYYQVTELDRATRFAGPSFDASVWELYPYLLMGATVYIIPNKIKLELYKLNTFFENNKITIAYLPTQLCEEFMKIPNNSLRCLLTGGDTLNHYNKNKYSLYNNYGPTENTVVATSYHVKNNELRIPIGRPIYNTQVYIVDNEFNLLPPKVPGEIVISGKGIAVGYLDETLNKQKFIKNSEWSESKLYLTGDIGMLNEQGEIEFLHRKDAQVQIRGYRIELGEIEYHINTFKNIESCVVQTKNIGSSPVLVCYYTSTKSIDIEGLKNILISKLPSYMVPLKYIYIDSIPLTPNGKIDKDILDKIDIKDKKVKRNSNFNSYEEELIASIWKKLFNLDTIFANTNFYEIGGESIKAVQFISKLHAYGYSIEVPDIYENQTVAKIAQKISLYKNSYMQGQLSGEIELLPMQKWYLSKVEDLSNYFNMADMVYINSRIDKELFYNSICKTVEHHDSLRTIFKIDNGKWKQVIGEKSTSSYFAIEYFDCRYTDNIEVISNKIQKKLSLDLELTISIGIISVENNDNILVCINHLVVDAYSFIIILQDLFAIYEHSKRCISYELPMKTASVDDWSNRKIDFSDIQCAKDYWRNKIELFPKESKIITNEYKYKNSSIIIPKSIINRLNDNIVRLEKYSIDDILSCVLIRAIYKTYKCSKVVINIEKHGRDIPNVELDISRTAGWFTVKYPVELKYEKEIHNNLYQVSIELKNAKKYGSYYDLLIYGREGMKSISYEPDISLNYLGSYYKNSIDDNVLYSNLSKGSSYDYGQKRCFGLDINCKTYNGDLYIDAGYNVNLYEKKVIENLLKEVYNETNIISLCKNNIHNDGISSHIIEGINPYSGVFYKDCYIQAIIPVLLYFEGDIDAIFSNDLFTYGKLNSIYMPIRIKNINVKSIDEILELFYISCNKKIKCDNIKNDIISALCKKRPVIIRVDCFNLPNRLDTYNKIHLPHVLLVVGFNDITKKFTVIDHLDMNSVEFDVFEVSYEDLEDAYYKGIEYFDNNKLISFYEYSKTNNKTYSKCNYKYDYYNNISNNIEYYSIGIEHLETILKNKSLLRIDKKKIISETDNIITQINSIILNKKAEYYAANHLLELNNHIINELSIIVSKWELMRKCIFEIKYSNSDENIDFENYYNYLNEIIIREKNRLDMFEDLVQEANKSENV